MKFEFDTTNDGATEAAALVAALAVLHGDSVAQALEKAADRIEITGTSIDVRAPDGFNVETLNQTTAAPASRLGADTGLLDTAGIPWDARIHASTKTTNKDGTWSRRRNTPDATYDAVMAELKAAQKEPVETEEASAAEAFGGPTPSAEPAAPDTDGSSAPASTQDNGAETSSNGQTATTAASPSSAPAAPITFPALTVKMVKAKAAGTLPADKADEILASFDVANMQALNSAGADIIQAVNALVDEHLAGVA